MLCVGLLCVGSLCVGLLCVGVLVLSVCFVCACVWWCVCVHLVWFECFGCVCVVGMLRLLGIMLVSASSCLVFFVGSISDLLCGECSQGWSIIFFSDWLAG